MRGKKRGPAASTAKARKFSTEASYHIAPSLSTAAEMIVLAVQRTNPANPLRRACFERLERVLKRHYTHRQTPRIAEHRREGDSV